MLTIKYQAAFKKDYKRIVKRGYDMRLLEKVIELLANQKPLPEKNRDHQLSGDYAGCRECHITPDWLLIYEVADEELILYLTEPAHTATFSKPYYAEKKKAKRLSSLDFLFESAYNSPDKNSTLEATFQIWQPVTTRLKNKQRCGVTWY